MHPYSRSDDTKTAYKYVKEREIGCHWYLNVSINNNNVIFL